MESRLQRWMNQLNMTYDNSYHQLSDKIREYYESQREVKMKLTHPLSSSPSVLNISESLVTPIPALQNPARNPNGCQASVS